MATARVPAAVLAYAFLIPFQPVLVLPDGSPLRIAAAELVAPLVLLWGFARPQRSLPLPEFLLLFMAIPLLALFSTLLAAEDRTLSGYAIGKTVGLFYLAALAVSVARTVPRGAEFDVLRALARGIVWSAVIGLVAFGAWAVAGIESPMVEYDRLCATMPGDPNIYCSLLAVALPVVITDERLTLVGRGARIGVLVLALLASGSRSGLVGAVVAVTVCLLARSRDRWSTAVRAVYGLLAAGIVGVLTIFYTSGGGAAASVLWEHLWRLSTIESRFDLYRRAFELFLEHPLLGLGIGGFNDLNTFDVGGEMAHYAVHNTYLWAFVDLGIGGGVLLLALIIAGVVVCGQALRVPTTAAAAAVVAGGLVAMAVFNLFVDGFYQRHFWILMGCALGMPLARRAPRPSALPAAAWSRAS